VARNVHSRLRISGTFVATTPLHVGGTGASVETDLPLAVNGSGNYYVPGTGPAGVMRAWCETAFPDRMTTLRCLWGWQDTTHRRTDAQDKDEAASCVFVENAELSETEAEIRDGVGIDRRWGTAADRVKFDRAVLPPGTRFPLDMTVELSGDLQNSRDPEKRDRNSRRQQMKAVIGHLLDALQLEQVRLGAGGTRGLGRIRLEGLDVREHILSSRQGILETLRGGGNCLTVQQLKDADKSVAPKKTSRLKVTIEWTPVLPTMTKSGLEGIEIDMLPLVAKRFCELRPLLTGGGIKGALRSHAERVIRTLSDCHAPKEFLTQVDVPLVTCLFGLGGMPNEKNEEEGEPLVGRAALDAMDCFAQPVPSDEWWDLLSLTSRVQQNQDEQNQGEQNRENPTAVSDHLRARLHKTDWAYAQHVAIDRWEGGASEGALYNALELRGETWEPIVLELDFSRLPEAAQLPAVALLLLVLEDFADGEVPLGFAGNRGMGSVKVTNVSFALENDEEPLKPLEFLTGKACVPPLLPQLHAPLKQTLHRAWTDWIETGLSLAVEAKRCAN